LPPPRVQVKLPTEETEYSADGEIYEAISHVDYEINGKTLKPMPPAMHSFQKSTMISSKPPADWGSDEYEDPENTQKIGQIPRSASLTQSSNNTYAMYQDPSLNAHNTLATSRVNNGIYSDTYQDPALQGRTTAPMTTFAAGNDIYGGTYQDPEQTLTSVHPGEPQQTYEVPGDSEISNPTRQYSALHRDENGFSLH